MLTAKHFKILHCLIKDRDMNVVILMYKNVEFLNEKGADLRCALFASLTVEK